MTLVNDAVPRTGTVIEKTGLNLTVQIDGKLGTITVPWKLVISDKDVQVGAKVCFQLSLLEVINL